MPDASSNTLKRLPVPPLEQTLEGYLRLVEPLLPQGEREQTRAVVQEFLTGDAPACQAELERLAETEHAAARHWFSQAWLDSYLEISTPLLLTSSYSPRITWPLMSDHVVQAADLIHRLTQVCLTQVAGRTEPEVSPRGDGISMDQWTFLAGGIRHPGTDGARLIPGSTDPCCREVVVLHRGNAFALQVSDGSGEPLGVHAVEAGLRQICGRVDNGPGTFTHLAHLGNAAAARHLDRLLMVEHNREVYERLVGALFVVNLVPEAVSEEEHLRRNAFGLGQGWPLKPVSFQVGLKDGWVGVQIEHTTIDGGTMAAVLARAAAVQPAESHDWHAPAVTALQWHMEEGQTAELAGDIAAYEQQAAGLKLRLMRIDRPLPAQFTTPDGRTVRLSPDAAAQWVMAHAQLAAFGRIRNTYESVAMLEYQAGRTEALRPNTPEAVALVSALTQGRADASLLEAAQRAHSRAVVACKTGNGVDRHLLGLRLAAGRLGLTPQIFDDIGYRTLSQDFLSTTSLGTHEYVAAIPFAPTSAQGLGVNYTWLPDGLELCVTWRDLPDDDAARFLGGLREGAERLVQLVELSG